MADELGILRTELDRIDEALYALVRDRMRCIERVGAVKARASAPVFQPGRAEEVERQAADYARAHGLSETFLVRLADLLMEEAIRVEEGVVQAGVTDSVSYEGPANSPPT